MATNFYFNNFTNSQEQNLIEDLVIETIKIYGVDIKYIKRTLQNEDKVYGEDRQTSRYTETGDVEMYIKNVEGFGGEGDFLSKFNLQIRDQMTFTVARRSFEQELGTLLSITRPREGDLIYFPLNRKMFEIKFVEHEPVFYQMGALQMYDLKCELFEYNSEYFNTGFSEIDDLYVSNFLGKASIFNLLVDDRLESPFLMESGEQFLTEGDELEVIDAAAENETIQTETDTFVNFSESNPFSESGRF